MKKYFIFICIVVGLLLVSIPASADSPVTSTQFSNAYMDLSIVQKAADQGVVTQEIAAYLSNSKNPIDVKAAVINAISWDIKGKNNAETYAQMIFKTSVSKLKTVTMGGDQLFCIGYLMAMDNYFETSQALTYLKLAEKKIPSSLTISIIRAIVESQEDLDGLKYIKPVLGNKSLKMDLRQDAINIILDYMALDADTYKFIESQNNFTIENEKTQRVYLYGTFSSPGEAPYMISKQSDIVYTAICKDEYGVFYLDITGIRNGSSSIEVKNTDNYKVKITFDVVSSEANKFFNNYTSTCLYVGSTAAYIGNTKTAMTSGTVPYIKNGRQYVSLDFVNNATGAKMQYDKKKGAYIITYSGKTISVKSGSNTITINGKVSKLSASVETKNKLLFIPASDYATLLGKAYKYYNGLIVIGDQKAIAYAVANSFVLNEISSLTCGGKPLVTFPLVFNEGENFGYKDQNGKVVIKAVYSKAYDFSSDGLACVAVKNKDGSELYGFIDIKGQFVIKPTYDWAYTFSEGIAPVIQGDYAGFIDTKGKIKIPLKFGGAGYLCEGLAAVCDIESGKWGYIDRTGKQVISFLYDDCTIFNEGLAAVKVGEKWGYIDRTGKMHIEPQYDDWGLFRNGMATVVINDGYYEINKSGKYCVWYDNGDFYIGEYVEDLADGYGIYTWSDGYQYAGEFSNGKMNGKGVMTSPLGITFTGNWVDDKLSEETK